MGRRSTSGSAREWIDEAARLVCDEAYVDYRAARAKAAERLSLNPRAGAPELSSIEAAVLERQRVFGGDEYVEALRAMRRTGLRAMKLLERFRPRLAGAAVSGAIGNGHRVQVHVFSDIAESVEIFLLDRSIEIEQGERRYRFADGTEREVPLCSFEADGIGIDIAVFDEDAERNGPLSAIDGKPAKRLAFSQLEALLASRP